MISYPAGIIGLCLKADHFGKLLFTVLYQPQARPTFYQRHFGLMPGLLWSILLVLLAAGVGHKVRSKTL